MTRNIDKLHDRVRSAAPIVAQGDIVRAMRLTDNFTHALVARNGKDAILEGFEMDDETKEFLHVRIETSAERPVTITRGNLASLQRQDAAEVGAIPEMMHERLS